MSIFDELVRELGPKPKLTSATDSDTYENQKARLNSYNVSLEKEWLARMRSKYKDLNPTIFDALLRRANSAAIGKGYQGVEQEFEKEYNSVMDIIQANNEP